DRSVDGIAATSEDSRTGGGGKIVLRREHRAPAHYERIHRRHLISSFLSWVLSPDRSRARTFAICARGLHLITKAPMWQKGVLHFRSVQCPKSVPQTRASML